MKIRSQARRTFLLSAAISWQISESFNPLPLPLPLSMPARAHDRTAVFDTRLGYTHSRSGSSADGSGKDLTYFDSSSQQELSQRIQSVHRQVLEEEWRRPPNANCSPEDLVSEILTALWESDDPLPDSGFLLLLKTATKHWRLEILKSIGAPTTGELDWQIVSSALGAAIARPKNQFGILVAGDEDDQQEMPYLLDFPFEALDYDDGTAWLECQLRDKQTNQLLVTTGWSLKRRDDDGPWLVDSITWHDVRDKFWGSM